MLLLFLIGEGSSASPQEIVLANLREGQAVNGFKTEALYLNDSDRAFGARFRHEKTGFIFDLLQIQSVPQAFIWVNTPVANESGVAHTQEHLLLGKGNKGRQHGTRAQMALVQESAGTGQWRTFYHFNTCAGAPVFYELLHQYLDLLLNPDYSDEEIRREVRNFIVKEDKKTKDVSLEEKGTVYNEMLGGVRAGSHVLWYAAMKSLYGKGHPLAVVSGGSPEGIRGLKPADIRAFHEKNYRLSNMGMICACPKELAVGEVLKQVDGMLGRLQKTPPLALSKKGEIPAFPAPQTAAAGSINIVSFPEKNVAKPGSVIFAWPPDNKHSLEDRMLLSLFLSGLAGEPDTPLYKAFVDSKTLKIDSGATGISAWQSEEQGYPVMITISDVAQTHMNKKDISAFRKLIQQEMSRIAGWKDGTAELKEFNKRLSARLVQYKRSYTDIINKPPQFGSRGNTGFLMEELTLLGKKGGFRRSVTMKPEIAHVEKVLKGNKNIWRTCLSKWRLIDRVPLAVANRPDPQMLVREEQETKARSLAEAERLRKQYGTKDTLEALRKYKAVYDRGTAELERLAEKSRESMKFIAEPPLTLDDQLDYRVSSLPGNIPLVGSCFDSMTSCHAALSLRLDGIAQEDLLYLSLLPQLLRQTGVIDNGRAVWHDEMLQRLRKEIYYLNAAFSSNPETGRFELNVSGAGTTPEETRRALEWMGLILQHPNWKLDNIHRIRDVVEQSLSSFRATRDAAYEENWDYGVEEAFRHQDSPLYLNTHCFLTMTHNAQRLRWQLKGDGAAGTINDFVRFMKIMEDAGAGLPRERMKEMLQAYSKNVPFTWPMNPSDKGDSSRKTQKIMTQLFESYAALPTEARKLVADAADDLIQDLPDIPDSCLGDDWKKLCQEIAADIQVSPAKTLDRFDKVRQMLLLKGGARLVVVGSQESLDSTQKQLQALTTKLGDKPFEKSAFSSASLIDGRRFERLKLSGQGHPDFAALVNARSREGIVINTAPAIKYTEIDGESLKNALALNLFGGGGAHSLFMKTWGAGMAYGNGPSWSCNRRIMYYADKMPSIADTLAFVAGVLKKAGPDPALKEYVVALCFYSRAGDDFIQRGEAMANNLCDKVTPETVRLFRQSVLKLRNEKDLVADLFSRMLPQYGKVIPGLGVRASEVPGACRLAIGDEKQLSSYEDYLKGFEGPTTEVARYWARDFWINAGNASAN